MGLPEVQLAPARLLSSSCSVEKTLKCSCSFHGIPTPSVEWLVGDVPVDMRIVRGGFQVTSTTLGPWANSTLHLMEPAKGTSILCEGKNPNGTHALSIFLMSPRSPQAPGVFLKGIIQGVVCGATAVTLIFLCLLPIIVNYIRMKIMKTTAVTEFQKSLEVKRSQDSKTSLRPEAPGALTLTSPPESWVLASQDKLTPVETKPRLNFESSSELQESTQPMETPENPVPLESRISKPSSPRPLPHTASQLRMGHPGTRPENLRR
ncbi:SIGLEC family-like protein 1 isoform 1-T2 [Thomomys bottae]